MYRTIAELQVDPTKEEMLLNERQTSLIEHRLTAVAAKYAIAQACCFLRLWGVVRLAMRVVQWFNFRHFGVQAYRQTLLFQASFLNLTLP